MSTTFIEFLRLRERVKRTREEVEVEEEEEVEEGWMRGRKEKVKEEDNKLSCRVSYRGWGVLGFQSEFCPPPQTLIA